MILPIMYVFSQLCFLPSGPPDTFQAPTWKMVPQVLRESGDSRELTLVQICAYWFQSLPLSYIRDTA